MNQGKVGRYKNTTRSPFDIACLRQHLKQRTTKFTRNSIGLSTEERKVKSNMHRKAEILILTFCILAMIVVEAKATLDDETLRKHFEMIRQVVLSK